jgi:hypothetical protein
MAEFYGWFVFLHIVGLVLFAMGHGVNVLSAFRIRAQKDPRAVAGALEASSMALGPMYIGLLLLIVGGAGAATAGELWGQTWIIASIIVLIAVIVLMYGIATPYYGQVREAVGLRPPKGATEPAPPIEGEALARLLDTRRPETLLAVGGLGLLILIWLMVLKPTL